MFRSNGVTKNDRARRQIDAYKISPMFRPVLRASQMFASEGLGRVPLVVDLTYPVTGAYT
jgi:hypothetical protein